MILLFIDYTNLVVKAYEEKREANQLSQLLMHPTPANIRQECLNIFNDRIRKGEQIEENTLRAFFGVPPAGKSFGYIIERFSPDRFRPLQSLIRREIKNPSIINVELLAWLIDFTPRPLGHAKKIRENTNGAASSVTSSIPKSSEDHSEPDQTGVDKNTTKLSIKNSKGNSTKRRLKAAVVIGLIVSIIFGGTYIMRQQSGNVNTKCMYWTGDHYEQAPCNEERKGLIPLNEETMNNFKKTIEEDSATKNSIVVNNINGRCQKITKKGTQCKRKAKSNGYCWQHGG